MTELASATCRRAGGIDSTPDAQPHRSTSPPSPSNVYKEIAYISSWLALGRK